MNSFLLSCHSGEQVARESEFIIPRPATLVLPASFHPFKTSSVHPVKYSQVLVELVYETTV